MSEEFSLVLTLLFWAWEYVALSADPDVQCREQEHVDSECGDEATHNDDGKWSLRIGAYSVGGRCGQQSQGRDQHGHHDGAKPKHGPFHRRFFYRETAHPQLVDVLKH